MNATLDSLQETYDAFGSTTKNSKVRQFAFAENRCSEVNTYARRFMNN